MPKKSKTKNLKRPGGEDEQLPPKQSRVDDAPSPLCFDSPASLFRSLIEPLEPEVFFRDYWEKKPLHLQRTDTSTVSYYRSLFRQGDLHSLCSQGLEYCRDVNVVRCVNGKKKVLNKEGRVKAGDLTKFFAQNKATVQFHQPQRFKDELWRIQEKLESFFGALVGSNVYITPQESQGLPPHYDDVEVFILQLEGQKRWLLYSPVVPLATEYSVVPRETLGNPTHDITLKEGDLLYFPRGTIHQASTPAGVDHSTHLTISTYQRTSWGDVLLDIFPNLLFDGSKTAVSLREGMPRQLLQGSGDSRDFRTRLATALRSLADEMEKGTYEVRPSQMKRDFIMNRLPPSCQPELLAPSGKIPAFQDTVCLKFKEHMVVTVEPSPEATDVATQLVVFVLHSLKNQRECHMMGQSVDDEDEEENVSKGLQFPLSHLPAIQQLQQAEQLPVSQLQLPTQEDKLNLALALWSESLLTVL